MRGCYNFNDKFEPIDKTYEFIHFCKCLDSMWKNGQQEAVCHALNRYKSYFCRFEAEIDYYLALCYWKFGEKNVELLLLSAVVKVPENYWLITQLARFYIKTGQIKTAKKVLEKAFAKFHFSHSRISEECFEFDDGICILLRELIELSNIKRLLREKLYRNSFENLKTKYKNLEKIYEYKRIRLEEI